MKKILSLLCLCVFTLTLTGCGNDVNLDLENIKGELVELKTNKFSPNNLYEIDVTSYFDEFEDIMSLEEYNLEYSDTEYFYGVKSTVNDYFYMVVLPTEEKFEDVKKNLDNYVSKLEEDKLKKEVYEGYLIYVYSENSNELLTSIKSAKSNVFPMLMEVGKESISDVLDLEEEDVKEFLMMQPMMMVNSSQFIIIKPASGKEKVVKEKVEEYLTALEEQWKTYLPEQYELVKNRQEESHGKYLIYIISDDNNLAFETIKNNEIK